MLAGDGQPEAARQLAHFVFMVFTNGEHGVGQLFLAQDMQDVGLILVRVDALQ